MRFICLHGVGSSGSILEDQLQPLVKACDPSFEFVCVDGPSVSVRGPGMGGEFSGPFWSHTEGYSPLQMEDALKHLEETIEEQGPFDGVVGFSQGAATAIAYMYDRRTRTGKVPFKIAILFSTVCAFSSSLEFGREEIESCHASNVSIVSGDKPKDLTGSEQALYDFLVNPIKPLRDGFALLPDIDLDAYFSNVSTAPRLILPELMSSKFGIPTVHMHGKKDAEFMRMMSLKAREMCDKKLMKTFEHSGSHHPPQKDSEVKTIVRAIDWAITQARKIDAGQ